MVKLETKNILVGCHGTKLQKIFEIITDKHSKYDYNITKKTNSFYINVIKTLIDRGIYDDDAFLKEMHQFISENYHGQVFKSNDTKLNLCTYKTTLYL